jgi:hypothetical protein
LFSLPFPCGINRSFHSFPIAKVSLIQKKRSLGFLTGVALKFRLIGDKPKGAEKGVKLDSIRASPYNNGVYMSNAGYILDPQQAAGFSVVSCIRGTLFPDLAMRSNY